MIEKFLFNWNNNFLKSIFNIFKTNLNEYFIYLENNSRYYIIRNIVW